MNAELKLRTCARVLDELFEAFELCGLILADLQEWTRVWLTCNLFLLFMGRLWK